MKVKLVVLAALLMAIAAPAPRAASIDPAVVGTWKLEGHHLPMFWTVRPDAVYRIHGLGASLKQFGRMEASEGRFSMKSVLWVDQGTYRHADPNTWLVTGKLGTGTWKRVWSPDDKPEASSPCSFVTAAEVARVLYAPVSGKPDIRAGDNGCTFKSVLTSNDVVTISSRNNVANFFQNHRKGHNGREINIPGIGEQAYAAPLGANSLELHFLKRGIWVKIVLGLSPAPAMEDLPLLIELARAAAGRI